ERHRVMRTVHELEMRLALSLLDRCLEHDTETGWKQEAEQHAEIRARVDQENEFLRKTLMEQMKFIQRLQDYFTKQPLLNAPSLNKMLTTAPS
ncbi:hypothetical protein SPRG_18229, partial [Saprolegnia parasitica CBS 223.65]